jgi:hypothetical protein
METAGGNCYHRTMMIHILDGGIFRREFKSLLPPDNRPPVDMPSSRVCFLRAARFLTVGEQSEA